MILYKDMNYCLSLLITKQNCPPLKAPVKAPLKHQKGIIGFMVKNRYLSHRIIVFPRILKLIIIRLKPGLLDPRAEIYDFFFDISAKFL